MSPNIQIQVNAKPLPTEDGMSYLWMIYDIDEESILKVGFELSMELAFIKAKSTYDDLVVV